MTDSFLETPRFPACPSFGYTSQPEYSVSITRRAGGQEKRNRNWSRPLHVFDCTIGPRQEDEIQELLEWWHALGGPECGFRFRDIADFKSCRVSEDASSTDQPIVATGGSPYDYQLVKDYTVGARSQRREIRKPISGTILIADGGVLRTEGVHYTIDYATGIVSLAAPPAGALTWGGEFDTPVRFASAFPLEVANFEIQSVSFQLQELRP